MPWSRIRAGDHEPVAVGVNRQPIEHVPIEFGAEPAFADLRAGVVGGMVVDRIGIEAAVVPAQRVAKLDVAQRAAAGPVAEVGFAVGKTFDGNFAALAAVPGRINRHGNGITLGRRRVLFPVPGGVARTVANQFQALVFQGGDVAGSFVNLGRDVTVGEREVRLVLDHCDRCGIAIGGLGVANRGILQRVGAHAARGHRTECNRDRHGFCKLSHHWVSISVIVPLVAPDLHHLLLRLLTEDETWALIAAVIPAIRGFHGSVGNVAPG